MSHISLFVAKHKLSNISHNYYIQINRGLHGKKNYRGTGGSLYRVGMCPMGERTGGNDVGGGAPHVYPIMFLLTISGRSRSVDGSDNRWVAT